MTAMTGNAGSWRRSPWRAVLYAIPAALLLTPAVAMQFTSEVQWSGFDFVAGAVLLFGTAGVIDLASLKAGSLAYRLGAALAVLIGFLLIWINGAVGFIGDEDNPANLLFIGIILLAVVGAVFAGFRARGMAYTMFAAAFAQTMIGAMILAVGWGAGNPPGTVGLTMLNGVFIALWLMSGGLFRLAARDALKDS